MPIEGDWRRQRPQPKKIRRQHGATGPPVRHIQTRTKNQQARRQPQQKR